MPSRWLLAAVALSLGACAHVQRAPETTAAPPAFFEEGVASVYANGLAGRLTANGEHYDPSALTAAHKSLPLGTRVRVVSLSNGRSVWVRINDRGPYVSGRIIDLSSAAAAQIGLVDLMQVGVRLP
jgi:rare lipoprotein A